VYYKNSLGKIKIWLVIYGNIDYNTNWEYTYITRWFKLQIQCWLRSVTNHYSCGHQIYMHTVPQVLTKHHT